MKVKKVALQDLELWPDEVICFTAYTDTRNPVQQRRTYVDGTALKTENAKLKAENAKLRELVNELWETDHGYAPDESELDFACDMTRELGIEVPE